MTWDFWQRAQAFLRPGVRVLFIGSDPEPLLALGHPFSLLDFALPPALCPKNEKRLGPLGARVYPWQFNNPLPIDTDCIDFLLDFHQPYDVSEISRVLKSKAFFLTEQIGGSDAHAAELGLQENYNLENQKSLLEQANFRVAYANQEYSYVNRSQDYVNKKESINVTHRFILTANLRA